MSTTHVFLLQHTSGTRFLLGHTADLRTTLGAYSLAAFDFGRSVFFTTPDTAGAARLVKSLTATFDANLVPDHHNSPDALWLQMACWTRMLAFLEHVGDIMPHTKAVHPMQAQQVQAQKVRHRWPEEKLKQLHEQQERAKLSVQDEVARTSDWVAKLIAHSDFAAVVRTLKGYVLVGQAVPGYEHKVEESLDYLMSASSGINEFNRWGPPEDELPPFYAAELNFQPGQRDGAVDSNYAWTEQQVWALPIGLPGLDATLGWQEAKRAADMLVNCPRNYLSK